jgi:hypothetical protein
VDFSQLRHQIDTQALQGVSFVASPGAGRFVFQIDDICFVWDVLDLLPFFRGLVCFQVAGEQGGIAVRISDQCKIHPEGGFVHLSDDNHLWQASSARAS